ncbi:hypothetical protein CcCBS67573_g03261 [Chytriomyces confervae]|uniref:Uncharacterized protein n=1 Tax=Chytriomyces confervae TaxID=246404 RepID=A0A507FJI0_9FUNG|nr:hypothetical protein HDU80_010073 [Chytriomyces hyalinus]TPX75466.1 hypothetical protein CcCBS67573_g03261 [Chytriomyces confervae]
MSAKVINNIFGSKCGALQTTFDTCASNSLYNPTGQQFQTVETFCASLQFGPQYPYYLCLCDQTSLIVACYNTACASDATFAAFLGGQTSYCNAAKDYRPASTSYSAAAIAATASSVDSAKPPSLVINSNAVTAAPVATASSSSVPTDPKKSGSFSRSISALVVTACGILML